MGILLPIGRGSLVVFAAKTNLLNSLFPFRYYKKRRITVQKSEPKWNFFFSRRVSREIFIWVCRADIPAYFGIKLFCFSDVHVFAILGRSKKRKRCHFPKWMKKLKRVSPRYQQDYELGMRQINLELKWWGSVMYHFWDHVILQDTILLLLFLLYFANPQNKKNNKKINKIQYGCH